MAGGYDIIVLAGQSNTVGHGLGPYSVSDSSFDGLIFQVGRIKGQNMQIVPMKLPLQFWNNASIHAYGLSLARYYAANLLAAGRKLLIVPAACAGTSVLQWLEIVQGVSAHLYLDMQSRIEVGLNAPGGGNRVVLVSMHLGEQDMAIINQPAQPWHSLMPDAATFHARLLDFIDKFRGDFGNVPLLMGKYSPNWNPARNLTVKPQVEAYLDQVTTERQYCATIDTAFCPDDSTFPDGTDIHFSAQGQEMLAPRHFAAAYPLLSGGATYTRANELTNGNYETWSNGTSINLAANTVTPIADDWTAYRQSHGEVTLSQVAGFDNAAHALKCQRNAASIHCTPINWFQHIPDDVAASLAGQKITAVYAAIVGANWSANGGNFRVTFYTAPGVGEDFDEDALQFQSDTTASTNFASQPTAILQEYFATYLVPADCTEMVIRFSWTPTGTAGADDSISMTNTALYEGIVPLRAD